MNTKENDTRSHEMANAVMRLMSEFNFASHWGTMKLDGVDGKRTVLYSNGSDIPKNSLRLFEKDILAYVKDNNGSEAWCLGQEAADDLQQQIWEDFVSQDKKSSMRPILAEIQSKHQQ